MSERVEAPPGASERPLFFFGAMSPYSWFAAERIGALLPEAEWRPVFAGGLFRAAGRTSWGLTARREAGIVDCEARARAHGLGPIRWPDRWPTSDLLIARAMVAAAAWRAAEELALAAMRLSFREGRDLGEPPAVEEAAARAGIDVGELRRVVEDDRIKAALREATDVALARGVVGVPTVMVGEELFWGDDRLEAADDHARARADG